MAAIGNTTLTLRFLGDDLDPAELTELLGGVPKRSWVKGEIRYTQSGDKVRESGAWLFSVPDRNPGDLDGQFRQLFSELCSDLGIWRSLTSRFDADFWCGLFMADGNEGFTLEPDTLAALSERGLRVHFDIYDPTDD
jgi:hypothetical protein